MSNSESEDQKQQLDAMSEEQQLLFFYDNYLICTRIKMIIISKVIILGRSSKKTVFLRTG